MGIIARATREHGDLPLAEYAVDSPPDIMEYARGVFEAEKAQGRAAAAVRPGVGNEVIHTFDPTEEKIVFIDPLSGG